MAGSGVGRKNRRLCSLKDCVCKQCGSSYQAVMARSGFCTKNCASKFYHSRRAYKFSCVECGVEFLTKQSKAKCCGAPCLTKRLRRLGLEQGGPPRKWASRADAYRYYGFKRRAVTSAADADVFSSEEIFERDGWLCQLCGEEIDRDLVCPDPKAASLDHKIPVSRGGRHTRDNVQCAHFGCNSRKQNKLICEIAA